MKQGFWEYFHMTIDTGQWTLIPSLGGLMIYFVPKAGIIQKTTAWEDTAREERRLGWQKSGGESLISYQTTGSFFHQEHSCCVSCRRKCFPECICTWSLFLIFLRSVASELLVLDHRQRSQQQIFHGNTDVLSLPSTQPRFPEGAKSFHTQKWRHHSLSLPESLNPDRHTDKAYMFCNRQL